MASIDRDFRKRTQSVLAVDKMIADLHAALAAVGEADNTYVVFSSDNGYHMGEHRLMPGKMTAYDTDIHVPLIITDPGVPEGVTIDAIAENVDLHARFTEPAGVPAASSVDGRRLVPLLRGQTVADRRTGALIELRAPRKEPLDPDRPGPRGGNPTTHEAISSQTFLYVEYADGQKEYHSLVSDPDELRNAFSSLPPKDKAWLHATIETVRTCQDAASCAAAGRPGRGAPER